MKITLTTLNARYYHASLALRYLYANLGTYQSDTTLLEFTINQDIDQIVSSLAKSKPEIIGFSVYIWNIAPTTRVIEKLKAQHPEILIVLGGPEVTYSGESEEIIQLCDYYVSGEGDVTFPNLIHQLSLNPDIVPKKHIGILPDLNTLKSPYSYYNQDDIQNRTIYVEASRGCPFRCEFCLSSLDQKVRNFPLDGFLQDLDLLIQKGVRQFKFIDRTFNLSPKISTAILDFFLERMHYALFLHFELIPDFLPESIRTRIQKFPPGSLQFEIGVQTWNPEVSQQIQRRQNYEKITDNLTFLRQKTHIHLHCDLIVGLPQETMESFAHGFNELFNLNPHEIQVGMLKLLKGTPLVRHQANQTLEFSEVPPYEILQSKTMTTDEISSLRIFSKFWDRFANSGHFPRCMEWIRSQRNLSPFDWFFRFAQSAHDKFQRTHSIDLVDFFEFTYDYFLENSPSEKDLITAMILLDYTAHGNRNPWPLRKRLGLGPESKANLAIAKPTQGSTPKRQSRFL